MMPPMFGDITPESVAYQCVIAGCCTARAAGRAGGGDRRSLEPDFNLLGIATTTGSAADALCVHGLIARQLGINAAAPTAIGPGIRANACIGRALQLCLRNIGGAAPTPATWRPWASRPSSRCASPKASEGPFPSLTERHGLGKDVSAITVMGISGTAEVLPGDGEGATPEAILDPIVAGMRAEIMMSGQIRKKDRGEQVVLLPLETRREDREPRRLGPQARPAIPVRQGRATSRPSPEAIHPIVTGGAGYKMAYLPIWGGGSQTVLRRL